jgi:amidase
MARTVADLAFLLPIIAGPDWQDPAIIPMPMNDPNVVDLKQLKVAFHTDNGVVTPTPEIMQTVADVANMLQDHVQSVEEACPERLDETWTLWSELHNADGANGIIEILQPAGTTESRFFDSDDEPEEIAKTSAEFGRRLREIDRFRSQMLQFISQYDILICPVNANPAIKHGTLGELLAGFTYTAAYNLVGWPGAVVRAGTSPEGLPIGVQILAQPWREDAALAVAQLVEAKFGGWQPPSL